MTAMASSASASLWHPDLLVGALGSKRLTLLYGAAGPQRDGMVRRGLMPRLRQHRPGGRRAVAIRFDGWGKLPLRALHERIAELQTAAPDGALPTLAEALRAIGGPRNTTVLLVLDAFERHLAEPAHRLDVEAFDRELAACITDATVPAHVLMVIDEAAQGSLARYRPWLTDVAGEVLRLPSDAPDVAAPWSDTDIDTSLASDEPASPGDDADWALDLVLDGESAEPAPASPAATTTVPVPPHEPGYPASAATPAAAASPDAQTFTAPPVRSTAAASADRRSAERAGAPPVPPWLTEADVAAWRRMDTAPSRWPGLLGLALVMAGLGAVAWIAAHWILDMQRIEPAPRAPAQASTRAPPPSPPVIEPPTPAPVAPPTAQATAPPAASPAEPPATAPAARAVAPPTAQPSAPPSPVAVKTLTYALPLEADSAAPMFEALTRQIAAPAGLDLRPAAPGDTPLLTLRRTDALLAARGAGAAPLQVVAPLFTEQVQVVVRNDARWDYVREIRGLRLNIGAGNGARANTVRTLYQQLFGVPLPAAATDERDVAQALQQLLRRGGPIDAMVVVSESPLLAQLPSDVRRQLRELTIDRVDLSKVTAMPAFSLTRRTPGERPRLSVTTFLVAAGAPPRPQDDALRQLAAALCRAQPALQAQQSPLLRGLAQGQQPDVGWPYLLPRQQGQGCPSEPAARAGRRGGQS
jgi:hypothetical protein